MADAGRRLRWRRWAIRPPTASPGGFPLIENGKLIGAIGCSGATGAQDAVGCKAGADTIDPWLSHGWRVALAATARAAAAVPRPNTIQKGSEGSATRGRLRTGRWWTTPSSAISMLLVATTW